MAADSESGSESLGVGSLGSGSPGPTPLFPRHEQTFPALTPETVEEIANMGAILIPKCPITSFRDQILEGFEPALSNRLTVELTPCWDLSLKN